MRLLKLDDDGSLSFETFSEHTIPPYAILSHTWGSDNEEVKFKDILDGIGSKESGSKKLGFEKLWFCGKQAKLDGLHYFWVDTCCIQKSDSSELTESINSMFK
jgi:hypothetical protein